MKSISLKLQNFGPHEETEINFSENPVSCVVANSGTGKSYLIDALIFCLFGGSRKRVNAQLVRRGQKRAVIDYKFIHDDGNEYEIIRTIEKGKDNSASSTVNIFQNGKNISEKKKVDAEAQILNLIGMNYELYTNSVVLLQDNVDNILNAEKSKKKEFFINFFELNKWDDRLKKVKEFLQSAALKKIGLETVINQASESEESIESLTKNKEEAVVELPLLEEKLTKAQSELDGINHKAAGQNNIKSENEANERLRDKLSSEISSCDSDVLAYEGKIKNFKEILSRKDEINSGCDKLKVSRVEVDQYNAAKSQHTSLQSSISLLESSLADISRYDTRLKSLEDEGKKLQEERNEVPKCNKCGEPVSFFTEKVDAMILAKREEYKIAKKELEDAQDLNKQKQVEIDELKKKLAAISVPDASAALLSVEENKKYEALKTSLDSAQSFQEEYEGLITKKKAEKITKQAELKEVPEPKVFQDYSVEIQQKKTERMLLESDVQKKKTEIALLQERIEVLQKSEEKVKVSKKELEELEQKVEYAGELEKAFSKNGIPLFLLDMYLPVLENSVNERLKLATDFSIKFSTEREKSSGEGMVDTLDILIYDQNSQEDNYVEEYEGMSGGQKTLIRFAFILALSELKRNASGVSHNFLILDEAITGFDPETETYAVKILDNEMKKLEQLMVISHLKSVQDLFSNIIMMKKEGGIAKII